MTKISSLLLAGLLVGTLPAVAQSGKSLPTCRSEVGEQYPRGTLSKKSGTREKLIAACMRGAGTVRVPVVRKGGGKNPRQSDREWLQNCVRNGHPLPACQRWLRQGRKGGG